MLDANALAKKLISWQTQQGRQDLPWQQNPTPYRVWVSEIMLQQTQVETVKNYYLRFMQAFPDLDTLANASIDKVLQYWTGLGYYARARNLHKSAQMICNEYGGAFPNDLEGLMHLPGIGRSTAGAILSLAMQQSAAILDGNVKRVLCRVYAISDWPGTPLVHKHLWDIATHHTPKKNAAIYNQAMMDLGAMVCTRNPNCSLCPLQKICIANQQQLQSSIPQSKPKKTLPTREGFMLVLWDEKNQCVLLEKRPMKGIWGGLWCFPECPRPGKGLNAALPPHANYINTEPVLTHAFTHYRWHIKPVIAQGKTLQAPNCLQGEYQWYNIQTLAPLALAAPVKRLLQMNLRLS